MSRGGDTVKDFKDFEAGPLSGSVGRAGAAMKTMNLTLYWVGQAAASQRGTLRGHRCRDGSMTDEIMNLSPCGKVLGRGVNKPGTLL
jgi:hypothetical protein